MVPPEMLVNQHSSFPLPLPIRIPLGFRVNGRCGKAKNQINLRVWSDFFIERFKKSLNLNNWLDVR
jgi:hypothetical protein